MRHLPGCVPVQSLAPVSLLEFQPRTMQKACLPEPGMACGDGEEEFREHSGERVKRTKWAGIVRNACIALGNAGVAGMRSRHRAETVLKRLRESRFPQFQNLPNGRSTHPTNAELTRAYALSVPRF